MTGVSTKSKTCTTCAYVWCGHNDLLEFWHENWDWFRSSKIFLFCSSRTSLCYIIFTFQEWIWSLVPWKTESIGGKVWSQVPRRIILKNTTININMCMCMCMCMCMSCTCMWVVTDKYHIYCSCVSTKFWQDREKNWNEPTKRMCIYGGLILPYPVDRDHVHVHIKSAHWYLNVMVKP